LPRAQKAPAPASDILNAFQSFDAPICKRLLSLRQLIYETAEETPQIGALSETLKWGQPSYTPLKPDIGSSIRLGVSKDHADKCALFFICHTNLVEQFREVYASELRFEGNRTIIVDQAGALATKPLNHCIAMALTYHLNK